MTLLDRRWRALAIVAVVAPFVVILVRVLVGGADNPSGDLALIELRVRDVGVDTPLLGSYGRFGFNQPGPLWFYVLAVPYRLLGSRYVGLQVGAVLLHLLCAVAIVRVVARRGGRGPTFWCALLLGILALGFGPAWIVDAWEPHGLTLAVAATLVLAFDVVAGRDANVLWVVVLSSLLAQAQAGLVTFAVAMLGVAVAAVGWRALRRVDTRAEDPRSRRFGLLAASAGLWLLLWALPLVEELRGGRGNLTATVSALRHGGDTLGVADGWRTVALELGHRAPWVGFDQPLVPFSGLVDVSRASLVPIGLVALVAVLVVDRRRRGCPWTLGLVVVLALLSAVTALANLLGELFLWIPEWTRALGFATALVVGWAVNDHLTGDRRRRVGVVAGPVLVAALLVTSVTGIVRVATYEVDDDPLEAGLRRLADEAAPVLAEVDGDVVVRSDLDVPSRTFGQFGAGLDTLVLGLDRAGVDVRVPAEVVDRFGPERGDASGAVAEARLVSGDSEVPEGFRVVAEVDPLAAEVRAERAEIEAALDEVVGPDPSLDEVVAAAEGDREVATLVDRLRRLPGDLPVLVLVLREPG